jgi:hypothetical protein
MIMRFLRAQACSRWRLPSCPVIGEAPRRACNRAAAKLASDSDRQIAVAVHRPRPYTGPFGRHRLAREAR